jgi:hypothetical protein
MNSHSRSSRISMIGAPCRSQNAQKSRWSCRKLLKCVLAIDQMTMTAIVHIRVCMLERGSRVLCTK